MSLELPRNGIALLQPYPQNNTIFCNKVGTSQCPPKNRVPSPKKSPGPQASQVLLQLAGWFVLRSNRWEGCWKLVYGFCCANWSCFLVGLVSPAWWQGGKKLLLTIWKRRYHLKIWTPWKRRFRHWKPIILRVQPFVDSIGRCRGQKPDPAFGIGKTSRFSRNPFDHWGLD